MNYRKEFYSLPKFKRLVEKYLRLGMPDETVASELGFKDADSLRNAIDDARDVYEVLCRFFNESEFPSVGVSTVSGRVVRNYYDQPFADNSNDAFSPTKIIQNGPAYVVFWSDGTKTVIKRKEDDEEDPYSAFGQALAKKIFGSTTHVHKKVDACYQDHTPCGYSSDYCSISDAIGRYMDQIKRAWKSTDENKEVKE